MKKINILNIVGRLVDLLILKKLQQSIETGYILKRCKSHLLYVSFALLLFVNSGFMLDDVNEIKKTCIELDNANFSNPIDSNIVRENKLLFNKTNLTKPLHIGLFHRINLTETNNLGTFADDLNDFDEFIPVKCPDFKRKKRGLDLEFILEAGYFSPIKYFELTNAEVGQVERLRINNEITQEGVHIGFYGKLIGRQVPITLQVGVTGNKFTEKMNLNYAYIERDTTQGIVAVSVNETGDTISSIIGDIVNLTEVTGSKEKHYRNQMIDLPITMGYEFNFNNFSIGFDAGVIINLGLKSEGYILRSETDFDEISNDSHFKLHVGISYLGRANIAYKIGSKSKLYLNTTFRIIPEFFNVDGNTLNQKYNFLGVNLAYAFII